VPLVASSSLLSSSASSSSTTSTACSTPTPSSSSETMKSRKKARKVTTLFHKLTKERDAASAQQNFEEVRRIDSEIDAMGGRPEYQRASVLSTSFHSTSKWVLGQLKQNGWLYGIRTVTPNDDQQQEQQKQQQKQQQQGQKRLRELPRRPTRILEVGAINTELLDAADSSRSDNNTSNNYKIHVRAIDIHSMAKGRIEEYDFLDLPYIHSDVTERYDVIVCSMVINCVTTPEKRGEMLAKLYHHLRPGGLCFLTLPKFCLIKSAFLTTSLFEEMLGRTGAGFEIVSTRSSPRVSFFVLRRPELDQSSQVSCNNKEKESSATAPGVKGGANSTKGKRFDPKWTKLIVRNKGTKFPNQFSVVLDKSLVMTGELSESTK